MTSANSSLVRFFREQKSITGRRLAVAALSLLSCFLYDVVFTAIGLQRERAAGTLNFDTAELAMQSFPLRGAQMVSSIMGFRGIPWLIGCGMAVILAVQGYAYLNRQQTVDFYESRPEKRSFRFWCIFINGCFIWAIPSLVGVLCAFLLAAANGCSAGWLFTELLLAWCFQMVLFLAVYALSVLATLLTGTVVTAVLMNLFFFGIETLLQLTIAWHREAYYATYYSDRMDFAPRSLPLYHYLNGLIRSGVWEVTAGQYTAEVMLHAIGDQIPGLVVNLIIFTAAAVAAFLLYRARRAEFAGRAVTYRPVAVLIKCSSVLLFSLCGGLFVYWIFDTRYNGGELPSVLLTIGVIVFIGCILLESIFAFNIRAAFHRLWEAPVIFCAALIVLFVYRTDAFGYDRWLPDEAQVESAFLMNERYIEDYYDERGNYMSKSEYLEKHMFLTDIGDLITLARLGQAEQVRHMKALGDTETEPVYGWYAVVEWRMKNGRRAARTMFIPESVDTALMDRIVGSEEYLRGNYQIFDEELFDRMVVRGLQNGATVTDLQLTCQTEYSGTLTDRAEELFGQFADVYRRDLLKYYDFSLASNKRPIGCVALSGRKYYFGEISFPLFECFDETIAFLTDNGLYKGGELSAEDIAQVNVEAYFWDDEGEESVNLTAIYGREAELPQNETIEGIREIRVNDPDRGKLQEIMGHAVSQTYFSAWQRDGETDDCFSIYVTPEGREYDSYNYCFRRDEVPEFIMELVPEEYR